MGLLRRLFSKANDLPALRKAMAQKRYADALLIVDELSSTALSPDEHDEVEDLSMQAGDNLAQLNLHEGLFFLRDNQLELASDHLQLAQDQAKSPDLRQQVAQALQQAQQINLKQNPPKTVSSSCSSCSTCAPQSAAVPDPSDEEPIDFDSLLELILSSYPEDLAKRYMQKSTAFLHAFVAGHQGAEIEAMQQFGKLTASEQDDLFDFEVGSLMARLGEPVKGCDALYSALQKNPDLLLAAETLVTLLVSMKKHQEGIDFIKELLDKKYAAPFCHAQLAAVYHSMGNAEQALHHGRTAIDAGHTDMRIVLMTAMLLEANNELEQAEDLYRRIPAGGGCGGPSVNLYLAEFLLRQKRELRKLLDVFNNACRQEADNPRWQLRVAQTYLALGWDKRGQDLLKIVIQDPSLMEELRTEGEAMLANNS
ncbi:MAG: tetratricopeptide repeat protein [Desulfuromonas sp.]|nr:tetratricopeptide repeat protein [Desulfuromonas sp.]